ncbi:hypothetical protein KC19_6G063900 [Ceratodon purpureus]|uniref:Protein kinase domain-containing protein n=1 Tax=Ceratodon purpureus TaxID=3225 RepID=A0A8T0HDS1_CERPU|nr:hypothetical protein KC19_6G063900 [Ceratodon purpureus]
MVHPMKITAALVRLFKTVRYDEISGDTQPTRASTTLATIPQVASSSNGVASRSEQLKQLRSRCATELEYEIESSKEHWTELDSERSEVFSEELMAENREAFKRLMEKWRCPRTGKCFFHDWGDSLKVRKKIAEGGQAEIFEAEFQDEDGMPSPCDKIVVKVFKSYHPLKDLERIWPLDPTQLQNFDLSHKGYTLDVADFESSVAVVGTGFWRAPEVLIALKNKEFGPKTWTRKGDVYSYAMTCYEVITGFIPFEDVNINVNDVISGARPSWHNIEDDIDDDILNLVSRCWHPIPLERPSFKEIVDFFNTRLYFVPSSPKNQGERTYSIDYTTEIMNKYYI